MKTRLKAKKEEKTPTVYASHGPCKVRVELDKTDVIKDYEELKAKLHTQLNGVNHQSQVSVCS